MNELFSQAARHALPYAASAQRTTVTNLLAIRAEIAASLRPDLDHQVAHTRLAWWQEECQRAAGGSATHPLMRALSAATQASSASWPELGGWIRATALLLAGAPFASGAMLDEYADADGGTLFLALAQLLAAPDSVRLQLRQLGALVATLAVLVENAEGTAAADCHALLRATVADIPPALQPRLRVLLVWLALAVERPSRLLRHGHAAPSAWQDFADTLLAWRCARAANRQSFQLRPLQEVQ